MNENDGKNDPLTTARESSDSPEQVPVLISDESSSDTAEEIYSVSESAPRVYPTGKFGDSSSGGSGDETLSLEEIYSRRRAQEKSAENREAAEEDEEEPAPIPIPRRPFLTRIFRPLLNPGMLLKFFLLASALWVLLLPVYPLFQRCTRKCLVPENRPGISVEAETKTPQGAEKTAMTAESLTNRLSRTEKFFLGAREEIVFGAFRRYGYFFLFSFLIWGILALPFFLQIFEQTANGDDKLSGFPEWNPVSALGRFAWFLLLLAAAGIPGYFLFFMLGAAKEGFLISALILFPIFCLSTADTDSFFCLLSRNVLKGIRLAAGAWRDFFITLFVTVLIPIFVFFMTAGYGIFRIQGMARLAGMTLISGVVLTFWIFFFFRFLGRLAWVLKDRIRKENEEMNQDHHNVNGDLNR